MFLKLFKAAFFASVLTGTITAGQFASHFNEQDIQRTVNFLTATQENTGVGYIGTAGNLNGLFLPLSYYSTPEYWGKYVIDQLGNNGTVTDVYNGSDYTLSPSSNSPGRDLQYERVNVFNGTDIYDAATWQIAVALAAQNGLKSAENDDLLTLIDNQNQLLTLGYDGNQIGSLRIGANRATSQTNGLFKYNGQSITDPKKAYFFRMVTRNWLSKDPFQGTAYESLIEASGLPPNPDYQKGRITWADWKPITGENAWGFLIGPLQADYIKHVLINKQKCIPFDTQSVQNAVSMLSAFHSMQSPIGAVYYAVSGSLGNTGNAPVNPYEVSVENNASLLSGLWILQDTLKLSLEHEELPIKKRMDRDNALDEIKKILLGGIGPNGKHEGLISFFKTYAYKNGLFVQGGLANDPQQESSWVPTESPKAVDVQTWTMTVLGQPRVDRWFGFGAAFQTWESTKKWGSYSDNSSDIWGVGYSDLDQNKIISGEWTLGALNLVRALIVQYQAVIDNPTTTQEEKDLAVEYVTRLSTDEVNMSEGITHLTTDNYANTENFLNDIPENYNALVPLDHNKLAVLYANKRYMIPFGWYANPLPSTCSSSWLLMLYYNYNPFTLGGTYSQRTPL